MDVLHTYVYHIWNEWARGFATDAVTPWFVREDWLQEDQEIFEEFIVRIGCKSCFFFGGSCQIRTQTEFEKVSVPCQDPNI